MDDDLFSQIQGRRKVQTTPRIQGQDWRSDPTIEKTRRNVRKHLTTYISKGRKGCKLDKQSVERAVNRVERSLFNNAASKVEYGNPKTLIARLKAYIKCLRSHQNCKEAATCIPNSNSSLARSSSTPIISQYPVGSLSISASSFLDNSVPSGSSYVHILNGHASGFSDGASHGGVQGIEGNILEYIHSSVYHQTDLDQLIQQQFLHGNNQGFNRLDFQSNLNNGFYSFEGVSMIPEQNSLNSNSFNWNSSIPIQAPPMVSEVHETSPNTTYQNCALASEDVLKFQQLMPNSQQFQHQTLLQDVHSQPCELNQQSGLEELVHGIGSHNKESYDQRFQLFDPQDIGLYSMTKEVSMSMSIDQKDLQWTPHSSEGPFGLESISSKRFLDTYSEIDIFKRKHQPQGPQGDEDFGGHSSNSLEDLQSIIKYPRMETYEEPQQLNSPSSAEFHVKGAQNCNLFATPIHDQMDYSVTNECDSDVMLVYESAFSKEHTIGSQQENVEMETEYDHVKLEVNEEIIEPCSKNIAETISEKLEKKVASMTETFTIEQIEEHISSLRQMVGQNNTERSNAMASPSNEGACRLCTVEKHFFHPAPIFCSSCGARIKHNAMYHTAMENDKQFSFCNSCYKRNYNKSVTIDEFNCIPKDRMQLRKNNEEMEESWVQCGKCEGWQHQICALFNDKRNEEDEADYTCPKCYVQEIQHGERIPLPQNVVPGAKELPRTSLSEHIEKRLYASLKQERQERADALGKKLNEVDGAEDLTVRVVCSVYKRLNVNQKFLDTLQEENYPKEFPYRSKAILLFQKIEGVDVVIFAMYVQEFGLECDYPNKHSVYISYLDSVKYFRPEIKTMHGEALRTFVFHELLIGYLDYCKRQGFTKCHIWTCPPSNGDDYILYCHPNIQRMPTNGKLRKWYLSMLEKAAKQNIVVAVSNLYEHFFVSHNEGKVTAANLPYFEGDYLPTTAETMINVIEKEEEDERKAFVRGKKEISKTSEAMKCANFSNKAAKDILLMKKLGESINTKQENFIMIHLQFSCVRCYKTIISGRRWFCNHCKNSQLCNKCYVKEQNLEDSKKHPIKSKKKHIFSQAEVNDVPLDRKDEDEYINNKFIETREDFLRFCVKYHYQFDTLRRAKHSTMMILHHLHNPIAT